MYVTTTDLFSNQHNQTTDRKLHRAFDIISPLYFQTMAVYLEQQVNMRTRSRWKTQKTQKLIVQSIN